MATKQQLKSQVDSLHEENERLEGILQQQAVDSPHTPWRLRTQRSRDEAREALLELGAVRRENTLLHNEVQ